MAAAQRTDGSVVFARRRQSAPATNSWFFEHTQFNVSCTHHLVRSSEVRRVSMRQLAKFREDPSDSCRDTAI